MSDVELRPGQLYILAGLGPLRYEGPDGQSELFRTAFGATYHASRSQVVRAASDEDLEAFIVGHERKGMHDVAQALAAWRKKP